jgi:hypothetical protein
MAAMKITLSAAMRARDVSRPRPEQLTEAAAREEATARARLVYANGEEGSAAEPGAVPGGEDTAQPRARRRRRRGR